MEDYIYKNGQSIYFLYSFLKDSIENTSQKILERPLDWCRIYGKLSSS